MSATQSIKAILQTRQGWESSDGHLCSTPAEAIKRSRKAELEDKLPQFIDYDSYYMANYIYEHRVAICAALNREYSVE